MIQEKATNQNENKGSEGIQFLQDISAELLTHFLYAAYSL
jgi:hypothetical protein